MNSIFTRLLNGVTMYRLVLYSLVFVYAVALIMAGQGKLTFGAENLLISGTLLVGTAYLSNWLLARFYGVPINTESALITGLIMVFILRPPRDIQDGIAVMVAAVVAMASKYVVAYKRKHILNPAAFGVAITGLLGLTFSYWWVGTPSLLPFVLVVSLFLVQKTKRIPMASVFMGTALLTLIVRGMSADVPAIESLAVAFSSWPLVFFVGFMLTEPLTMPSAPRNRLAFAVLVALAMVAPWHIGSVRSSPELALLLGNLFALVVSRKSKPLLILQDVTKVTSSWYELTFKPTEPFQFEPGQYAELTLGGVKLDARGNRRTFTIASSLRDPLVTFSVKVPERSSNFKSRLIGLKPGTVVGLGVIAGEFIMPKDTTQKLVFLAGGIGITPFLSMVSSLRESAARRDIVIVHAISALDEAVYEERLTGARQIPVHTLLSSPEVPESWHGKVGKVSSEMLMGSVPDYQERTYYLSGPPGFVDHCKGVLVGMGIRRTLIVTDYFSGY